MEIETVKGFGDYLIPDSLVREKLREIAKKWFKRFGFLPIETPIVEFDSLMKKEGEDEAVSDRFRLKDRGGRELGLRYEFTFQLSRIFKQNPNIKLPFRRFQIGEVFRDEPLRTGRTRQFTQCDIDIIGDNSVRADAECLAVMGEILKELGIKFTIKVNNRKLLNSLIESVEIKNAMEVMRELDKIDKIGEDEVRINLRKYASANQIITLFRLLEKDLKFFRENAFDGADEIKELEEYCKDYNLKIKFSPFLVRGFGYYDGNIFEIENENGKVIMGGGRYGGVVGKFLNRDISAVGVSFSLEALMGLCEEEIKKIKIEKIPKAMIISISMDEESVKLAMKLRKNNVSCVVNFGKVKKAMEYANSYGIKWVVFVGEEEASKKKYKLKNLENGKESWFDEKGLIKKLSK